MYSWAGVQVLGYEPVRQTSDDGAAFFEMVVGQVRSVLWEARGMGVERFFLAGVECSVKRRSSWACPVRFAREATQG